ncbi:hypothetical protein [Nocardioides aquaticus]|uniref:hypothetical protein n=1 Tax=Nocardioides aquaticus TaxID=160826 RepID=UPI001BD5CD3C|nr:hypothetical protein [Nocardioides aquaticus]
MEDGRAKRRTITLPCGFAGHAKTSKLGTTYFAHNPGGDGCSAGESAQHLLAKATIVDAALAAGWHAEPEVPGDGWVADVMATRGNVRVAFEVQWSRQSLTDYEFRQKRYRDAGIASTAWFARHTDGLPLTSRDLPILTLAIDDENNPVVTVGTKDIPLSETIQRLLTGRLKHRDWVANGQPAHTEVEVLSTACWNCRKDFVVWDVAQTTVTGNCESKGFSTFRVGVFSPDRPENDNDIKRAVAEWAGARNLTAANMGRRVTKTSGAKHMAFVCPHCNRVSGDVPLSQEFAHGGDEAITCDTQPTAVAQAHWCLAGDAGVCFDPPDAVRKRLDYEQTLSEQPNPQAAAVGAISVNHAVARMFGGY